ncbi:MAG: hypothetical protein IJ397_05875 [Lachnospiraceae bacterium]|nr:hypothetical protein [Lachnospiraceae bacterium]
MTKKILITIGVILAAVVLIVVLLVVALLWGLYYITELEETKVNEFYSDDGKYTLTMYEVGDADFPFGSVNGKFVLKDNTQAVINTCKFSVADDGAGLKGNVPAIRWTDNSVMAIVSGSEQKDQLYIMYYDGTLEDRQSSGWYTTEELTALVKDAYGENAEYVRTVEPSNQIYTGNGPYIEPTEGYHVFRIKVDMPEEGTFKFRVSEDKGVLVSNYVSEYFKYTTDCFVAQNDVLMEWEKYGSDSKVRYIPEFHAQIENDRQQMEFSGMICDYVEYCKAVDALATENEWFEQFDFLISGKPGTLKPTITIDRYDRTLFYNEVYQKIDDVLRNNHNIVGQEANTDAPSEEVLADWLSREPACTFTMEDGMELRLVAVDRVTGNDYYALIGTYDGENCAFYNTDPYNNRGGLATGMLFVDENVGFITISWGGEEEGAVYRTEDGGKTFELSHIPSPMIEAGNGTFYNPYVLPEKIYEKEGLLYLEVSQGANKTYESEQGYCKGLYSSDDLGLHWDYVREVY